jgi:hypothetical protein
LHYCRNLNNSLINDQICVKTPAVKMKETILSVEPINISSADWFSGPSRALSNKKSIAIRDADANSCVAMRRSSTAFMILTSAVLTTVRFRRPSIRVVVVIRGAVTTNAQRNRWYQEDGKGRLYQFCSVGRCVNPKVDIGIFADHSEK